MKKAPPKKGKGGGKVFGVIPMPIAIAGGAVLAYLLYKKYKASQAASGTTAASAHACQHRHRHGHRNRTPASAPVEAGSGGGGYGGSSRLPGRRALGHARCHPGRDRRPRARAAHDEQRTTTILPAGTGRHRTGHRASQHRRLRADP